jgi:hypothetical protein
MTSKQASANFKFVGPLTSCAVICCQMRRSSNQTGMYVNPNLDKHASYFKYIVTVLIYIDRY